MKRNLMTPNEKVQSCLDYIDDRLETTSEQTLHIAETIIDDIKTLTLSYQDAMKSHRLKEHADKVHSTQMKWVNQLHDVILDQTHSDLNNQVIQALHKFANTLNQTSSKMMDFDIPTEINYQYKNGKTAHPISLKKINTLMQTPNKLADVQAPSCSQH